MSDFDEEAEREKLRKRFEAEEEDREVTARMSELLLQGATMTNRHCEACHSPIFTYQGQSFCPTCQVEVNDPDGGTTENEPAETDADAAHAASTDSATADAGAEPEPTRASRSATRIEVDDPGNGTDARPSPSPESESDASPEPASEPTPISEPTASTGASDSASATDTDTDATGRTAGTGDTGLAAAQASLSRTLSRLSQQAERSDDLSRTRDYLLAAQEAAEALTALKQARR